MLQTAQQLAASTRLSTLQNREGCTAMHVQPHVLPNTSRAKAAVACTGAP